MFETVAPSESNVIGTATGSPCTAAIPSGMVSDGLSGRGVFVGVGVCVGIGVGVSVGGGIGVGLGGGAGIGIAVKVGVGETVGVGVSVGVGVLVGRGVRVGLLVGVGVGVTLGPGPKMSDGVGVVTAASIPIRKTNDCRVAPSPCAAAATVAGLLASDGRSVAERCERRRMDTQATAAAAVHTTALMPSPRLIRAVSPDNEQCACDCRAQEYHVYSGLTNKNIRPTIDP